MVLKTKLGIEGQTFAGYSTISSNGRMDPEGGGGQGVRPLTNHKNTGFLSNTGPDLLKNYKATKPAFNFGPLSARQRNAIWRFGGEPMMACL